MVGGRSVSSPLGPPAYSAGQHGTYSIDMNLQRTADVSSVFPCWSVVSNNQQVSWSLSHSWDHPAILWKWKNIEIWNMENKHWCRFRVSKRNIFRASTLNLLAPEPHVTQLSITPKVSVVPYPHSQSLRATPYEAKLICVCGCTWFRYLPGEIASPSHQKAGGKPLSECQLSPKACFASLLRNTSNVNAQNKINVEG